MKFITSLALVIITSIAPTLHADTIIYRDGKKITAVVEEESLTSVTVNLYGQRVEIPRGRIESIEKSSVEENERLKEEWKTLDDQYKRESREAEERAFRRALMARKTPREKPPRPPTVPRRPAAIPPAGPLKPRGSLPAGRPPSLTRAPKGKAALSEKQRELLRMQEVKKAISEKRVLPGMTKKEVRSAWGWPERTHPVHGIDVDTDRWTYRREGEGSVDLYFRNGVLVRISR